MYIDFLEIENLYLHELTEDQRLKKLKYKVIKEEKNKETLLSLQSTIEVILC